MRTLLNTFHAVREINDGEGRCWCVEKVACPLLIYREAKTLVYSNFIILDLSLLYDQDPASYIGRLM